jgi:hypothetical protein
MRHIRKRRQLNLAALAAALILVGGGCKAEYRPERLREPGRTAAYRHGGDVIELALGAQKVRLLGKEYPLQDCSNGDFYCFKSEEIGLHFAFPKKCNRRFRPEAGSLGGHRFDMVSATPHLGPSDGSYVSDLAPKFAFFYISDRGLIEIRYDKTGKIGFGPGQKGGAFNSDEAEPYSYLLVGRKPFLPCKGGA